MSVTALLEPRVIPTYPVGSPEKNPLFFDKRVYQGSSGKVYPLPFIDKVHDEAVAVEYQSARLENEFVRLVMLPEIGGRIFLGQDKSRDDYDFFYRQDVIKPALVGLAGPWVSGGVEFNWPQHHRPGTFMPADVYLENEADGAATVWMSEHDPLNRLKGMHGVRIRPGSSLIELRARLYNRTPYTQTFLWWANVAAMVHDQYQSFFPPDVSYVADHAVRALSSFPYANNPYYGVDYQNCPGANDLRWYKNIPVATSYMICQTDYDFFGGYDFQAGAGFVHVADRAIAPGKKQWTWGNHPFGWAWDRELTDENGPYVELMAGVYTDNQPDFSYLQPYETKTFSQYWWPIHDIGPVQQANRQAAIAMHIRDDRKICLGLNVSSPLEGELLIRCNDKVVQKWPIHLTPSDSWKDENLRFDGDHPHEMEALLFDSQGVEILRYRPVDESKLSRDREQAVEPARPKEVESLEELLLIAEHLEQYRHPTRDPDSYLRRCLEIDSNDLRANLMLGKRMLKRGEFGDAELHLAKAIGRLTSYHPNPSTGEAHYYLGIAQRFLAKFEAAEKSFDKAAWDYAWRSASHYQLATLACSKGDFTRAESHLDESLATNRDHSKAKVLKAILAIRVGKTNAAKEQFESILAADPLDHWARLELSRITGDDTEFLNYCRNDAQTIIDLVFELHESGLIQEALELIEFHQANPVAPCATPNPMNSSAMIKYIAAWLKDDPTELKDARSQPSDYFFPSRLEEQVVLEWALSNSKEDSLAAYGLGNLLYDKGRKQKALDVWELAQSSSIPQVHRNLAIASWNVNRENDSARSGYLRAIELDSQDPRLVAEYDQLCAKLNDSIEDRLQFLEEKRDLVLQRDDASVSLATLLNLSGRADKALNLLLSRPFHPWEGGEGAVLRQFTNAKLLLGQESLNLGDATAAHQHFIEAMETPDTLGEKYHLHQAKADVNYWIGRSLQAMGKGQEAIESFTASANEEGDFAEMAVVEYSPLTYYRGLSLNELGKQDAARDLFSKLKDHAEKNVGCPAHIDYFATSLPNLLVFEEDLQQRRDAENYLLLALAHHGLGNDDQAKESLEKVLAFNQADPYARILQNELAMS